MKYAFKKRLYKILVPILDVLGYILFLPLRIFRKPVPANPKNILIVRLDHIGDFVCTTPLFRNIKKRFPEAKITVLVNSVSKDLASRDPHIDKLITFSHFYLKRGGDASSLDGWKRVLKDIKAFSFDIGIDPRGDMMSIVSMWLGGVRYRVGYGITGGAFLLHAEEKYNRAIHVIDRNMNLLKRLGIRSGDRAPEVYYNDKDRSIVEETKKVLGADKKKQIVLHPYAGTKAKEWPFDNFRKVIDWLNDNGFGVLLVGSKHDAGSFDNVIDFRGKINLPQLAYLIKDAGFFIGLDSGPANIAAALNVPSVIICSGTNTPQLWIPDNSNVKLICSDVECKPCENKICPSKNRCMISILPEDVIMTVKGMVK
jgi:ADP-heptose:LPS heptosyltransferase